MCYVAVPEIDVGAGLVNYWFVGSLAGGILAESRDTRSAALQALLGRRREFFCEDQWQGLAWDWHAGPEVPEN